MKKLLLLSLLLIGQFTFAQKGTSSFNDKLMFQRGKSFLINNILNDSDLIEKKFKLDFLEGDGNELSTFYYKTIDNPVKKEGIIFGFYNEFWEYIPSDSFLGYVFVPISLDELKTIIDKINLINDDYKKFLNDDNNQNNVYFSLNELDFIIQKAGDLSLQIRIYWNDYGAVIKRATFRRLEKSLDEALNGKPELDVDW